MQLTIEGTNFLHFQIQRSIFIVIVTIDYVDVAVVEQATVLTVGDLSVCEIYGRPGFAFYNSHNIKYLRGSITIRNGRGGWVAGWWVRGQIVGTVVYGGRLFEVLRPSPTCLAGNIFKVRLIVVTVVDKLLVQLFMVEDCSRF